MWESGHEEQEKTCNRVVFTSEEREKRKKKKKTVPKTQFLLLGTKPKLSLLYIGKVKLFSMIAKLFVLLCCNYTVITVYTLD